VAPDFNPVAEAKSIVRNYKSEAKAGEWVDGRTGTLVDYIDALTAALREAQQWVEKVADEWDHEPADVLAHTIRHLLDD
jgi:hypothetical protein